jgi:hypothetical protein
MKHVNYNFIKVINLYIPNYLNKVNIIIIKLDFCNKYKRIKINFIIL